MGRRLFVFCFSLLVVLLSAVSVLAQERSITIVLQWDGDAVPGGKLVLYSVGFLTDAGLVPSDDFSQWDGAVTPESAAELSRYAAEKQIAGQIAQVGQDGTAEFEVLQDGIYLLSQSEAACGYLKICPFYVCVPQQASDQEVYHIVAAPKIEPIPPIPETDDPFSELLLMPLLTVGLLRRKR